MHPITLDPVSPAIDGRLLSQLCDLYLQTIPHKVTRYGYRNHLRRFCDWWRDVGPWRSWRFDAATMADFDVYLRDRFRPARGGALSVQGRADTFRRLRQLLRWGYTTGRIPVDASGWYAAPVVPRRARLPIPLSALAGLLAGAGMAAQPERDRAVVAFLAGTGCRRGELAGLLTADIQIHADGSGVALLRVAKLDRPRPVVFDATTGAYLRAWLDLAGWPAGLAFGCGDQAVFRIVKRAAARGGVADQIQSPHDLRRLFATYWADRRPGDGYGRLLSDQLGHSSYRMTDHYVAGSVAQVAAAFVSPVAAIANNGAVSGDLE